MLQGLKDKFKAPALAATLGIASFLGSFGAAASEENNQNAEVATQPTATSVQPAPLTGKLVELSYGEGFDILDAMVLRDALKQMGCPVTLNGDGFLPNAIHVNVEGKQSFFTRPGSAGAFAHGQCAPEDPST